MELTFGQKYRKADFGIVGIEKRWSEITVLSICALALLTACATTGSGTDGLSLREAIEQSAERIATDLPPGTRIAVTAFESENSNLSDYIMEELSAALVDRSMEVVERLSLEYVYRELNFQMSGDVSDESAQSIGKFLGAQMVLTGQLRHLGAMYRFAVNAIRVEEATRASATRFEVRNDRALRTMITAMKRQEATARSDQYEVGGSGTPQTAGALLDRGILFAMRGDYDIAIEDFTEAIRLNPDMEGAYLLRARALFASVSEVFDVKENFSDIDFFITRGRISEEQSQIYDLTIEDLTHVIRLNPNNAVAYKDRGAAYINKGDYDRAIADCNQAIRLDPNDSRVYNDRGLVYQEKGDHDRAMADYIQSIKLDPNYAVVYNNRGNAYYDKGDYNRAVADYNKAIKLKPNDAVVYRNRGKAYYDKGDYNRAIADYNKAIKLDPNNAIAYNNRGVAYYDKRDYNRAIADYTEAIRLDPNDAVVYNNRGNAYYAKRDYDRAIADYEVSLRLDPDNAVTRQNLEYAQWARGR